MKRLLIIFAVLAALAGFGIYRVVLGFVDLKGSADAAGAEFHRLYSMEQAGAIYEAADLSLRTAITREEFTGALADCRQRTGRVEDSSTLRIHFNDSNGYKTLTTEHRVTWEKASGTERLLFDNNGKEPRLLRCEIDSPALKQPVVLPPAAVIDLNPSSPHRP